MRILESNKVAYSLAGLIFIIGVITIFLTTNSFGGGDNFAHFKFAHWGWQYPELLFNHWGKPVFTLLVSPFAQIGMDGVRIFNLLLGVLTALIVYRLSQILNFRNSNLSILLVIFTPIYFILMFTTLTEVSFSFFLALSTLLFFQQKYLFSAIVLSFLPIIRTEGIVLFPLFVIAFSLKKHFLCLPFITTGFWLISLLGIPYHDDFWWLITQIPYSGNAADIYGSGSFFRYIFDTRIILGYPIGVLFIIGLLYSLFNWGKEDKYKLTDNFYFLLLITGSYIVFVLAHSYVWWQGMGNSAGLFRVIASVTPFAALTALVGLNRIGSYLKSENKYISYIVVTLLLTWIVIQGIKTHWYGFSSSTTDKLFHKVNKYIKENKLDDHKVFYYNSQVIINLGLDPFDGSKSRSGVPDPLNPGSSMADSSIIVWDAHFGPNEGRLPLNRLLNCSNITLLKEFKPKIPFKVLGDNEYAIYVFQKIQNKQKQPDSLISQSKKTFFFDYEESQAYDSSYSYSGGSSLLITHEQEFTNFLNISVVDSKLVNESIEINFAAAIKPDTNDKQNSPVVVCAVIYNGENLEYQTFTLWDNSHIVKDWNTIQYTFKILDLPPNDATIKVYVWNKGKAAFHIDSVKIDVSNM